MKALTRLWYMSTDYDYSAKYSSYNYTKLLLSITGQLKVQSNWTCLNEMNIV